MLLDIEQGRESITMDWTIASVMCKVYAEGKWIDTTTIELHKQAV
jgi:hypothetical protein